jgi:hypothetical protein
VGVTVQGVGYRMEPVPAATIAAALAARRGTAPEDGSSSSKTSRRIIWEQEAEKTNIAYPHKEPSKAVRLKVGVAAVVSALILWVVSRSAQCCPG